MDTVLLAVPVQPLLSVTVTKYVPSVLMVKDELAEASLQTDEVYPETLNTSELPEQNELLPKIVGVAFALTVTVIDAQVFVETHEPSALT